MPNAHSRMHEACTGICLLLSAYTLQCVMHTHQHTVIVARALPALSVSRHEVASAFRKACFCHAGTAPAALGMASRVARHVITLAQHILQSNIDQLPQSSRTVAVSLIDIRHVGAFFATVYCQAGGQAAWYLQFWVHLCAPVCLHAHRRHGP